LKKIVSIHHDQRGQTLPGELIALAILAVSVGIVLLTIYTGMEGVKVKQQRTVGETLARSQLELIVDTSYRSDPTAVPYPTVAPVSGYSVGVDVEYWTAPDGPFTTTVRDDGLQKIMVSVSGSEGEILQLECYKVDR
jgi:hypothetical protein